MRPRPSTTTPIRCRCRAAGRRRRRRCRPERRASRWPRANKSGFVHPAGKSFGQRIRLVLPGPSRLVMTTPLERRSAAARERRVNARILGMAGKNGAIKLVAGNSNPALARQIAEYLKTALTKAVVKRFADMEVFVEIQENVRGADVFVIQSTAFPANDHLMELLIIIDALRRASARRITAALPYFGYAGHARKRGPRTPISANLGA